MSRRLQLFVTVALLLCVILTVFSPAFGHPATTVRAKRFSNSILLAIALSATAAAGFVLAESNSPRAALQTRALLGSADVISLTSARLC
jgi:hypothetical protein